MRWTLIKHIVSERVCKWIRTIPSVGAGRVAEKESGRNFGIILCWILILVMGGLLLLAILRPFYQPPELLVAWGDDGSLPAVCYSSSRGLCMRQYTVLCPGGRSAATQLLFALDKRGCSRLETIFSSKAAAVLRGTRVFVKKKAVRELILLPVVRQHSSGLALVAEARSAGIAVQEPNLALGGEPGHHQHWEFRFWRGKSGELHWSFLQVREQVHIAISWQKNGILQLQCQDGFAQQSIKQFPRSSRCGTWQASLAHR